MGVFAVSMAYTFFCGLFKKKIVSQSFQPTRPWQTRLG